MNTLVTVPTQDQLTLFCPTTTVRQYPLIRQTTGRSAEWTVLVMRTGSRWQQRVVW